MRIIIFTSKAMQTSDLGVFAKHLTNWQNHGHEVVVVKLKGLNRLLVPIWYLLNRKTIDLIIEVFDLWPVFSPLFAGEKKLVYFSEDSLDGNKYLVKLAIGVYRFFYTKSGFLATPEAKNIARELFPNRLTYVLEEGVDTKPTSNGKTKLGKLVCVMGENKMSTFELELLTLLARRNTVPEIAIVGDQAESVYRADTKGLEGIKLTFSKNYTKSIPGSVAVVFATDKLNTKHVLLAYTYHALVFVKHGLKSDILRHNKNCTFLSDNAYQASETIRKIMADSKTVARLSKAGESELEKYSWAKVLSRGLKIVESI